jgi:hypothetical protein
MAASDALRAPYALDSGVDVRLNDGVDAFEVLFGCHDCMTLCVSPYDIQSKLARLGHLHHVEVM